MVMRNETVYGRESHVKKEETKMVVTPHMHTFGSVQTASVIIPVSDSRYKCTHTLKTELLVTR